MRMSRMFGETLRRAPADATVASQQLLVRAGFVRQLAAGVFSALPLGWRSLNRIEAILRQEMDLIGGQELKMPVVHPAELWQETGRWSTIGAELGRFADRNGRDMVLAMTHEEVVADLTRSEISSYRQLPRLIYHLQTKWRDDPRPRAGLIRVREFVMLDSYSLDADFAGLDRQYEAHYEAYAKIFRRLGLPALAVESDTGMMGGTGAHEFMVLTPIGEDTLIICDACGYTANRQVAVAQRPEASAADPEPLEKVATPDASTIAGVANFLGIAESQTAKAFFVMASVSEDDGDWGTERLVLAIVRGDMEVNETKLANAVGARELRPAEDHEIRAVGAVPGYASPVGLERGSCLIVVVDETVAATPNLVGGANDEGYHYRGTCYDRDYEADIVTDLVAAQAGDLCARCGAPLRAERGVEVGNIFKLGTRYSDALGCTYLDAEGEAQPVVMGSYGIGVGRALACVAELHHDDDGLIWPITVAPYDVHVVALHGAEEEAEDVYRNLRAAGLEVLLDDRPERPGVKFNDADLIGVPIRLTLGRRSLEQGGVEAKLRREAAGELVPLDEVATYVSDVVRALRAELE